MSRAEPNSIFTANLKEMPTSFVDPPEGEYELTYGDLQANFYFFLHVLVKHKIISITPEDYARLVDIVGIDEETGKAEPLKLTAEAVEAFNRIISGIVILHAPAVLRLIGDNLADRGVNDYFTIVLIRYLLNSGVNIEFLLSNHDHVLLRHFLGNAKMLTDSDRHEYEIIVKKYRSGRNLLKMIGQALVEHSEIMSFLTEYYLPQLQLMSAALGDDNEIYLFSHAPCGLETLNSLCRMFDVIPNYTEKGVFLTVEAVNEKYRRFVWEGIGKKPDPLLNNHKHFELNGQAIDPSTAAIMRLMWNRATKSGSVAVPTCYLTGHNDIATTGLYNNDVSIYNLRDAHQAFLLSLGHGDMANDAKREEIGAALMRSRPDDDHFIINVHGHEAHTPPSHLTDVAIDSLSIVLAMVECAMKHGEEHEGSFEVIHPLISQAISSHPGSPKISESIHALHDHGVDVFPSEREPKKLDTKLSNIIKGVGQQYYPTASCSPHNRNLDTAASDVRDNKGGQVWVARVKRSLRMTSSFEERRGQLREHFRLHLILSLHEVFYNKMAMSAPIKKSVHEKKQSWQERLYGAIDLGCCTDVIINARGELKVLDEGNDNRVYRLIERRHSSPGEIKVLGFIDSEHLSCVMSLAAADQREHCLPFCDIPLMESFSYVCSRLRVQKELVDEGRDQEASELFLRINKRIYDNVIVLMSVIEERSIAEIEYDLGAACNAIYSECHINELTEKYMAVLSEKLSALQKSWWDYAFIYHPDSSICKVLQLGPEVSDHSGGAAEDVAEPAVGGGALSDLRARSSEPRAEAGVFATGSRRGDCGSSSAPYSAAPSQPDQRL
jgi:hypothetical protein